MPLLRQCEVVAADEWQTLADFRGDTPRADDVPLIVPFTTSGENAAAFRARKANIAYTPDPPLPGLRRERLRA
jgi:hypothetical protein